MKIGKYITLKHEIVYEQQSGIDNINVSGTVTLKPFESVIVADNKRFCEIKGTRTKDTLDISCKSEVDNCVIKFFMPNNTFTEIKNVAENIFNAVKNNSPADAITNFSYPKIYDNSNQLIGTMEYYMVDLGNPSENYPGMKLKYRGKDYTIFSVPSHIDDKPALSIYENDTKLVAEIIFDRHKFGSPYTDLPKYDIYVMEDEYFNVACILTVIWNQMRDNNYNEKTNLVHLKERYKAEFIDNIRRNVSVNALPENMPLAKELYNAGKYDMRRMLPKIIALIIIVALIIWIIISSLN